MIGAVLFYQNLRKIFRQQESCDGCPGYDICHNLGDDHVLCDDFSLSDDDLKKLVDMSESYKKAHPTGK